MPEILCAVALGSNLSSNSFGDSRQILIKSIAHLRTLPQIQICQVSSWYQTKPVGPPQPDYLNGCLTCKTSFSPWQFLDVLQAIESYFGRERHVHWGARTLDLDLLFYGHWQIDTTRLQVPHPLLAERAFVLVPLAEIAGDWRWGKQSIAQLRSAVDCSGVLSLNE